MQHSLGVAHGGKVKCVHVYKDVKGEESDFDNDESEIETDYVTGTGTAVTIFTLHCESHDLQHMFHDGGPASYRQLADSLQVDYILNKLFLGLTSPLQSFIGTALTAKWWMFCLPRIL